MLEARFRSVYQLWLVDQVAEVLVNWCTPGFVTFWSLVFGLLVPFFLYFSFPIVAIACLLISGYLDSLDGTLAHITHSSSAKGVAFDVISDKLVEFGVILGLFLIAPLDRGLPVILMLGAMLLSLAAYTLAGKYVESESGHEFFCSPGLIERTEIFLFFILMIIFPGYFLYFAMAFVVLVTWTAVMRVYEYFMPEIEETEQVDKEDDSAPKEDAQ